MLRAINTTRLSTRVIGYQVTTTAGPSISAGIFPDEASSLSRPNAGRCIATLRNQFSRAPIVLATPGVGASNGSYVHISGDPSITTIDTQLLTEAGAAQEGTHNVLVVGYDQLDSIRRPATVGKVYAGARDPILLGIKFAGASGVVSLGKSVCTVVRNGTGDYSLTFKPGFGQIPVILPGAEGGSGLVCRVSEQGPTSCRVLCHTIDAVATDPTNVHLLVYGTASYFVRGGRRDKLLQTQNRRARLIAFRVDYTAGTPAIVIGGGDATLTDVGTGVCRITFASPFVGAPIVLANAFNARAVNVTSVSATSVDVQIVSAGGSAADDNFWCVVLGHETTDVN